ncbi:MAG: polysaccharide deacetylase family protein [Tannerella sp.]|jgi:hypothetical protein|nr:polysaccharide deacetylase family protein [Tannerella sp.]
MDEIIAYITSFLLGKDTPQEIVNQVGYTSDKDAYGAYRVVVVPSDFFDEGIYGEEASLPVLPLENIEGVPLLFGKPIIEQVGETTVVQADIIASTYFLISRYEEIVKYDIRDEHGRFIGKESLPCKAGFIHRPIVDEYGRLLRKWLQMPEPQPSMARIYLTHDMDAPFYCQTLRNVGREFLQGKNLFRLLKIMTGDLRNDPYYVAQEWLLRQDKMLSEALGRDKCEVYMFFKAGGEMKEDKPLYKLTDQMITTYIHDIISLGGKIGLHSSYAAGLMPFLIKSEKERFRLDTGIEVSANRHHYLASRDPDHLHRLLYAGITDDFTMGYADIAGFRLGTSRPVRWISPTERELTSLTLHPLTVMDSTLSEQKYMGLDYEAARKYCLQLIEQVQLNNGELILLWHNSSVSTTTAGYHRQLYEYLINTLKVKV